MSDFMDSIKWVAIVYDKVPSGDLPYVTHEGVLDLAGIKIQCYQLNDGRRIVSDKGLNDFLDALGVDGGSAKEPSTK